MLSLLLSLQSLWFL